MPCICGFCGCSEPVTCGEKFCQHHFITECRRNEVPAKVILEPIMREFYELGEVGLNKLIEEKKKEEDIARNTPA